MIIIIIIIATSLRMSTEDRSIALPFDRRPPALDGTLPGDVGFDPAGFTNKLPQVSKYIVYKIYIIIIFFYYFKIIIYIFIRNGYMVVEDHH